MYLSDKSRKLWEYARDAKRETWRPLGNPYPLPPLTMLPQGMAIAQGFGALDKPVAPLPLIRWQGPRRTGHVRLAAICLRACPHPNPCYR